LNLISFTRYPRNPREEHLLSGAIQFKVHSFIYELFRGKDSAFLYGLGCLTIKNSRILGEDEVCMFRKGFELKLIENEPRILV